MVRYKVTGMSCAACQARVEKAVLNVKGVDSCAVSLLTNSMGVEGSASPEDVISAVEKAGYGASLIGGGGCAFSVASDSGANASGSGANASGSGAVASNSGAVASGSGAVASGSGAVASDSGNNASDSAANTSDISGDLNSPAGQTDFAAEEELLEDRETPVLKRRLLSSIAFLVLLMYCSMGHNMLSLPLPEILVRNPLAIGLVQMLLALIVMIINRRFFISGFRSVMHGAANMDTLVALGSSISFIWSVYVLFSMTGKSVSCDLDAQTALLSQLYFEASAMILTLITVGKMLEARSKGKTTDALKSLIKLAPKTANIIADGVEKVIDISQIRVGDIFIVRPGESIPADGVVIDGSSAVNEAALTGESIPVDKAAGDSVSAATVNQSGYLRCRASRIGQDTTLSQIIKLVSDAAATKAPIAKTADRVSAVFVPAVIGIAIVTFVVWMLKSAGISFALARAVSVLVISCPCALGLATPVAIMVGNGVGAKHGILFKTAASLESAGRMQIVVLDKTGTITKGEPEVKEIYAFNGENINELLNIAYSLEIKSEHPLAKAVVKEAEKRNIKALELSDFTALSGNGLCANLGGEKVAGGSLKYISSLVKLTESEKDAALSFAGSGCTPLLFAKGNKALGIIAVADSVKPDSIKAVSDLKNMGIRIVMLTGDNYRTAQSIAAEAGIENVIAGVMPNEKAAVVSALKQFGKVMMVGDGINDAPALTAADIGAAIGAGSDVAIDAAELVLMNSRLSDVAAAIRLSSATLKNIRENLFWAFFYNLLCIPLASGCYIGAFGWTLNPMIGAAAMSLSSFCVVSNALRLNLFNMYSEKHDRKKLSIDEQKLSEFSEEFNKKTEETKMTKTMMIEGMMCSHCEARVKKALEAIDGVESAMPDHTQNIAVLTLSKDVDNAVLQAAVEAADYQVKGFK